MAVRMTGETLQVDLYDSLILVGSLPRGNRASLERTGRGGGSIFPNGWMNNSGSIALTMLGGSLDIEALRVGWVHNFNFPQYADLDIPATPAPEPGTLGLIGLGLVGLGAMKRRRRYS
jgi:PEP-CTERM motif